MLTETAHEVVAARVPPARLKEAAPPTAVAVPPQVLVRFGVEATIRPGCKLSVKAMPLSAAPAFGLLMLRVSVVVPFLGMVVGAKVFVIAGGAITARFTVLLAGP